MSSMFRRTTLILLASIVVFAAQIKAYDSTTLTVTESLTLADETLLNFLVARDQIITLSEKCKKQCLTAYTIRPLQVIWQFELTAPTELVDPVAENVFAVKILDSNRILPIGCRFYNLDGDLIGEFGLDVEDPIGSSQKFNYWSLQMSPSGSYFVIVEEDDLGRSIGARICRTTGEFVFSPSTSELIKLGPVWYWYPYWITDSTVAFCSMDRIQLFSVSSRMLQAQFHFEQHSEFPIVPVIISSELPCHLYQTFMEKSEYGYDWIVRRCIDDTGVLKWEKLLMADDWSGVSWGDHLGIIMQDLIRRDSIIELDIIDLLNGDSITTINVTVPEQTRACASCAELFNDHGWLFLELVCAMHHEPPTVDTLGDVCTTILARMDTTTFTLHDQFTVRGRAPVLRHSSGTYCVQATPSTLKLLELPE